MKSFFNLLSLTALLSFTSLTLAAPTANPVPVSKRDTCSITDATVISNVQGIVTSLKSAIQPSIDQINTAHASGGDLSVYTAAASAISTQLNSAVSSIVGQTGVSTDAVKASCVGALKKKDLEATNSYEVEKRQTSLTDEIQALIQELAAALNNILADLGLAGTLSFLSPLLSSLGQLILALIPVVDNLLALVKQLLDSLLRGLGLGLGGIL